MSDPWAVKVSDNCKGVAGESRQDILAEVAAVLSERQDRHGQAEDSFGLIAGLWSVYLADKLKSGEQVTEREASIMMALFKIARGKVQPTNRDNDRDAIGYMAIAADRCTEEGQKVATSRPLADSMARQDDRADEILRKHNADIRSGRTVAVPFGAQEEGRP